MRRIGQAGTAIGIAMARLRAKAPILVAFFFIALNSSFIDFAAGCRYMVEFCPM